MEGFKKQQKMQCFKEGGQVKYESRKEHKEEVSADIAQDKKIVKKAFKIHDTQSHEGKKTDLSKLKKGGRAKKEKGTVKKYDGGGSVFSDIKNSILGTPAQNAQASANEAKYLKAKQLQQAAGAELGPAEKMAMGLATLGQKAQPAGKCSGGRMRKGGKACQ